MTSIPPHPPKSERTLIDALLEEQRRLTAVEQFSRKHEHGELPAHAKYYRDLIPLAAPKPGEQYAFEVDLDACSGCKACVTACHSLNGLDDNETWRDVGLLVGGPDRSPVQQTITTACHHCVDPGCANGCPTMAYDKDPATGIVRHLDDQCIGCQYCLWKCPYEVPKYSETRGIVRKCDLCQSRLAAGEAPACVQACPSEAIRITLVEQQAVRIEFGPDRNEKTARNHDSPRHVQGTNPFLPDSPSPKITLPTTRYKSVRARPGNMRAADHFEVRPQPAHWPLIFMLLLTQLSAGLFVVDFGLRCIWPEVKTDFTTVLPLVALAAGLIGIAASVSHLGRPLQAWRSFLGWRTSWLSREVIAFGVFALAASSWTFWNTFAPSPMRGSTSVLAAATVVSGLAAVFCSVMVYADTRREFWHLGHTAGRFFGTVAILGAATAFAVCGVFEVSRTIQQALAFALMAGTAFKLGIETSFLRNVEIDLNNPQLLPLQRSALLLRDKFGWLARGRLMLGLIAGIVLPLFHVMDLGAAGLPWLALAMCLLAGVVERYLFFVSVAPAKMPGGL